MSPWNLPRNLVKAFMHCIHRSWSRCISVLSLQNLSIQRKVTEKTVKSLNLKSNCLEVFCKKAVPRNFAKFTAKYLCQSFFLIKIKRRKKSQMLKKKVVEILQWNRYQKYFKTEKMEGGGSRTSRRLEH